MKYQAVHFDPFRTGAIKRLSPTTEAQREIIVSAQMSDEANLAFNESSRLRITGSLDLDRLHAAIRNVTDRHDALHVVITGRGDRMCLLEDHQTPIDVLDLSDATPETRETQLEDLCDGFATRPINLQEGPLFWVVIAKLADKEHELLLFAHHVIADGWSFAVIEEEIVQLYNEPESIADLPHAPSYVDYAQLAALEPGDDVEYWVSEFNSPPPPLDLPVDQKRQAVRRFSAGRIDQIVPRELTTQIEDLARGLRCSVVTVMMAGFATLLHRLSGNDDIAVGLPLAGQSNPGLGGLVGHCVQTLPIRAQIASDTTFARLAQDIREKIIAATEHSNFTFGTLVQKVATHQDRSRIPLVSVLFNIDQASDLYQFGSAQCSVDGVARVAENFELSLNVVPSNDGMRIETMFSDSIYSEASVRSWLQMYCQVLRAANENPNELVATLKLADQQHASNEPAGTAIEFSASDVVSLVASSGASADASAVVCGSEVVSYATLHTQVDRLAWCLASEHGIGPGSIVGLYLLRDTDLLTAMLAVAKTGATYLPLDPGFPEARLAFMVEDTDAQLVICNTDLPQSIDRPRIDLRSDWHAIESATTSEPFVSRVDPDGAAYIIYTSGSTGKPKGVSVGHRALANFLNTMAHEPGIHAGDRLLAVTTLSFDISMLELLLPLTVGATVVVATQDESSDGHRLIELIETHDINVMQATPATWRLLLGLDWQGKRELKVLCGGEALPPDLVETLLPRVGELWNMYGPTETTIWSSCKQIKDAGELITIGTPIANTQLHILNPALQLQPVGVPGELYIGGDGLADGYHNRDELTKERFIDHPEYGRIYRTGDRARLLGNGEVQHLGRLDDQIKLRGYRIELGEIEAALNAINGVSQAAASVRTLNHGDERLVAFCVYENARTVDASVMRAALQKQLPEYMIPQHFIALRQLPVTPNNKIDRRALAEDAGALLDPALPVSAVTPEAMTPIEASIVEIYKAQLGHDNVGPNDNFFQIGGHSLTAIWVTHTIEKQHGTKIGLSDFFFDSTAKAIARIVAESEGKNSSASATIDVEKLDLDTPAHLSPSQHRMWLVSQLFPEATFYNLPSAFRLRGELDIEALQQSFDFLIQRQTALRTRFSMHEQETVQFIGDASESPSLELVDLSDSVDPVSSALDWIKVQISTPFDLAIEWPYRCRLFVLAENDHALFFMPHHIVFDGWSFDVFYAELNAIYRAMISGQEPSLAQHDYGYRDYCHWKRQTQTGVHGETALTRWRERLTPLPDMLEIFRDFNPGPDVDPAKLAAIPIRIEAGEMRRLRAVCEQENVTPYMMLLAAYAHTLSRWTARSELVIGTPMSGRDVPGSKDLVGLFVGALPLKINLLNPVTIREFLSEVRSTCVDAFADPDVPIEDLVRELNLSRHIERNPIFQVFFAFQDARERKGQLGEMMLERINPGEDSTETDLEFWVRDSAEGLDGAFQYRRAYFDPRHMEGLRETFLTTLRLMVDDPSQPLAMLNALPQPDQEDYERLNTSSAGYSASDVVSLVASSGASADASAVVCGSEVVSYATLHTQVDRLAWCLASEHGIGPGSIVGLYLLRDTDLLTAMLAVAKTGATYLPLDPGFPEARLAFMVEDTDAQLVICNTDLPQSIDRPRIDLRSDWHAIESATTSEPFVSRVDPDGAAYIIYTSGSTGKPKGVSVGHRALANFLNTMAHEPGIHAGDRLLAVTTLSFDISMLELLLPLTVGATVVVATQDESSDGHRLIELIETHDINVMQATPATWRLLLGLDWQGKRELKVLCGGEALPPDLVETLLPRVGELWNMYGPTETTIWSSCKQIKDAGELITIGTPIANTQLHILNPALQLQPVGVPGELYIGGDGLADGYHNRDELTKERFIDHPEYGRIYRTGDRARLLGNGEVQHLGRLDDQIKLRGYRIELGEIEAALNAINGVSQAAARVFDAGQGDSRLLGYFVSEAESPVSVASIRKGLRKRLPGYMVPSNLIELDSIPLTPNGKVDRNALPSLERLTQQAGQKSELESESQIQMAKIWAELIGTDDIGPDDNFFQLGGHSLLVIKAVQLASGRFGTQLRPKALIMENLREVTRLAEPLLDSEDGANEPDAVTTEQSADDKRSRGGVTGIVSRLFRKRSES
ncbi:MAG: amino acid adenylation domain-containing protein [Pseudomonadota bacterium]